MTTWPDNHIYTFTVPNHEQHKKVLLSKIEEMKDLYGLEKNQQGYWYDFDVPNLPRPYRSYYDDVVMPYTKLVADKYHCHVSNTSKPWFQQYPKNTKFGYHTHPWDHFSLVYYVELPKSELGTEFYNIDEVRVSEGDIIVFPAFLPHCAPLVDTEQQKTIIAFNFSIQANR